MTKKKKTSYQRYKFEPELAEFATPLEKEVYKVVCQEGSLAKAAKVLSKDQEMVRSCVRRLKARAARKGYSPEHGLEKPFPDTFHLKGTTLQLRHDEEGTTIERSWPRMWGDRDGHVRALIDAVERAAQTCKGIAGRTPKPRKHLSKDHMALYGIGDPHFGLLAWHREASDNWDLKIAKETTLRAIEMLADAGPASDEAILCFAGDNAHADDNKGRTPMSGNVLDTDSRWSKCLDYLIEALITAVKTLLLKHKRVHVKVLPGNHDPQTAVVLQICLKMFFAKEPRVTVDDNRHLYTYYRFGDVFLGFHHGHGCKIHELPILFATKESKAWDAVWRRIYTGHYHKEAVIPVMGTSIDILPTLAAADTWADGQGYIAPRSCLVDTWHKTEGLLQRNWVFIRHINQDFKDEQK